MVCSKAHQFDDSSGLVNPYQQEVILHMALQTTLIDTMQFMRAVFHWNMPRSL